MALSNTGFNDPVTKAARWFKQVLTVGVTTSPDFMIRNFVRDAVHAWAINPDSFKFGVDSIKGLRDAMEEDEAYWELIFANASFQGGYVHGTDPQASAHIIRRALQKQGLNERQVNERMESTLNTPAKIKNALETSWQKYRALGDKVENANRLATYKEARKSGKSLAQAVFEAKDLMDYSMRGNFQAMMWFTDVVPFLNARIVGLTKLGRAGKANKKEVGAALAKIATFSIALAALNDDDDRYKELADWEKDAYWHFFIGEEHFRLPKPFEIGIFAGTIPERMYHTWVTDSQPDSKLLESFKHGLFETLGFNPLPQALIPAIEVWGNRSFYFDKPIESRTDLSRLPEDRKGAYTSSLMISIGNVFGVSPKKLEHIWEGYTGTMGAYALSTADMLLNTARTGEPPRPSMDAGQIPVIKSFYRGSEPSRNTQYMTDFYDRMSEVTQIYNSIRDQRKRDPEAATQRWEDNADKLRFRKLLNTRSALISTLRSRQSNIMNSRDMTSQEKRTALNNINERINSVTRDTADRTNESF